MMSGVLTKCKFVVELRSVEIRTGCRSLAVHQKQWSSK